MNKILHELQLSPPLNSEESLMHSSTRNDPPPNFYRLVKEPDPYEDESSFTSALSDTENRLQPHPHQSNMPFIYHVPQEQPPGGYFSIPQTQPIHGAGHGAILSQLFNQNYRNQMHPPANYNLAPDYIPRVLTPKYPQFHFMKFGRMQM